MKCIRLLVPASLLLAGCVEFEGTSGGPFIKELPPEVIELASPHQNLQAVRVNPETNCYEYQHVGPVETIFLPLRTPKGNPICGKSEA